MMVDGGNSSSNNDNPIKFTQSEIIWSIAIANDKIINHKRNAITSDTIYREVGRKLEWKYKSSETAKQLVNFSDARAHHSLDYLLPNSGDCSCNYRRLPDEWCSTLCTACRNSWDQEKRKHHFRVPFKWKLRDTQIDKFQNCYLILIFTSWRDLYVFVFALFAHLRLSSAAAAARPSPFCSLRQRKTDPDRHKYHKYNNNKTNQSLHAILHCVPTAIEAENVFASQYT